MFLKPVQLHHSVFVTQQFAIKHNIKANDTIELELKGKTTTFMVTEILDYYFGNHIFIAKELLEVSYPTMTYNKIYVKTDLKDATAIENLRLELDLDEDVLFITTLWLFDARIETVTSDSPPFH